MCIFLRIYCKFHQTVEGRVYESWVHVIVCNDWVGIRSFGDYEQWRESCLKTGLTIIAASHAHTSTLGQRYLLLSLKYVWVKSGMSNWKTFFFGYCVSSMCFRRKATYIVYVHNNGMVDFCMFTKKIPKKPNIATYNVTYMTYIAWNIWTTDVRRTRPMCLVCVPVM